MKRAPNELRYVQKVLRGRERSPLFARLTCKIKNREVGEVWKTLDPLIQNLRKKCMNCCTI